MILPCGPDCDNLWIAGKAFVCKIIITKLADINGLIPKAKIEKFLSPPPPTKFKIETKSPSEEILSLLTRLIPGIVIVPAATNIVRMKKVKRIFLNSWWFAHQSFQELRFSLMNLLIDNFRSIFSSSNSSFTSTISLVLFLRFLKAIII